jgi:hypothetical protein
MRVLLDTNIFIYREDDQILSENLQDLLRILSQAKADVIMHPLSLEDLQRDTDDRRKKVMGSKIKTYPFLETPPNPKDDLSYLNIVGMDGVDNNIIDNIILYSIYRDAADFLITEDRGIHKKARKLGIIDRIFLIDEALLFFRNYVRTDIIIAPPALKNEYVYNLKYEDPIFDSLKQEYYPRFESWFKKISREGRKSWVYYRKDHSLGAILIYKIEDEAIEANPSLPKKRRLKIATLKVADSGYKIGELFIKMSTDLAIRNGIYEIYLTHFTKPSDQLIELISEYGFDKAASMENGEDVYVKELTISRYDPELISPIEVSKRFYPSFYDGDKVNKFIVPILPEFHNKLFTDYRGRQTILSEHAGEFIVEGNTIRKAYLSHSRIKKMKPGDLILFYRSDDLQAITSIEVVEAVHTGLTNSDQILKLTGKRTVFSREDIESLVKEGPISVFLFRHHLHLERPLTLKELVGANVLKAQPRSATEIYEDGYSKIKKMGGINEHLTLH